MKKSFWLSFDLGIKGDYESFYVWLAKLDAIECGDCLAYFKLQVDKDENPRKKIEKELKENIDFSKKDRIYVIWKEGSKVKGSFIWGARKAPPWAGFGPFQPTTEEST